MCGVGVCLYMNRCYNCIQMRGVKKSMRERQRYWVVATTYSSIMEHQRITNTCLSSSSSMNTHFLLQNDGFQTMYTNRSVGVFGPPTSKFIFVHLARMVCSEDTRVYTGSGRTSLRPIRCCSCYRHLVCSRGYKRAREGKDLKSLVKE